MTVESARAFHEAARQELLAGQLDAARRHALAGLGLVDEATAPALVGRLRLMLGEIAATDGRLDAWARWSLLAERAFALAGDDVGSRDVALTRTLRALLEGDGGAGERLATTLVPELDHAGEQRAAAWVRIAWAQRALDDSRAIEALTLATEVLSSADPQDAERLVASVVATRAMIALHRPDDAVQVAAAALAQAGEGVPDVVRGLAYRELGSALAQAGHEELAHLCLDVADGLAAEDADLAARVLGTFNPRDPV